MDQAIAVPVVNVGGKTVAFTGCFTHLVTEAISFKFDSDSTYELLIEFKDDAEEPRISSEPEGAVQRLTIYNLNSSILQGSAAPITVGSRKDSILLLHFATMRTGEGTQGLRITYITIVEDPR